MGSEPAPPVSISILQPFHSSVLKPLELPWRVRLWHFIRGLLFYNTVYWKRASDGLRPTSLSREERRTHQPARNLEIIRPREHPRAKLSAARGGQVSLPTVAMPNMPAEPGATEGLASEDASSEQPPGPGVDGHPEGSEVIIKRRRYRRKRSKARPSHVGADPTVNAKASYFGWLFTGRNRR